MKLIVGSCLLLLISSYTLVFALQAIHVEDPAERDTDGHNQLRPPLPNDPQLNPIQHPSNTTFFLSVIPVQEPIRDDLPPPSAIPSVSSSASSVISSSVGSGPVNSQWSDKSQTEAHSGNVTPRTGSNIYEDQNDSDRGRRGGSAAAASQKTTAAHDHNNSSTLRSISTTALIIDSDDGSSFSSQPPSSPHQVHLNRHQSHHRHHHHHQRESSEFLDSDTDGEKEFKASPQLGHWTDEHDFKRLLTDNENVFYPMRSQPASTKSTSFIGQTPDTDTTGPRPKPLEHSSSDYDKPKIIHEIPTPKFHSTVPASHLSSSVSQGTSPSQPHHHPKFNDFIPTPSSNTNGPPIIDIPHYLQRHRPEDMRDFLGDHHQQNHRTAHLMEVMGSPVHTHWPEDYPMARPENIRVHPLMNNPSHRSTNFISGASDHPYTFDFQRESSVAVPPPTTSSMEFLNLNEYPVHMEKHLQMREHHRQHLHHLPRQHGPHGYGGPWKKVVHVLAAAIPLGLVISALTPHVVFVNPNDTSIEAIKKNPAMLYKPFPPPHPPHPSFVTYYPRWRALVENAAGKEGLELLTKDPNNSTLSEFFTEISNSLTNFPGVDLCEDRAFCQMARMGADKTAKEHHKMLWKIANETTESQIRQSGMRHIFRAIKEGRCEKIKCKKV